MYNTKELNTMLLEAFPELKERFEDETSWDNGIETGSYIVYEDIFMPYVVQAFVDNDQESINRVMQFVEELSSSDDVDVKNLIGISIIDNVRMYDIEERFASLMGPNSRVLYNAWEND